MTTKTAIIISGLFSKSGSLLVEADDAAPGAHTVKLFGSKTSADRSLKIELSNNESNSDIQRLEK